jgi:hypothetical protein
MRGTIALGPSLHFARFPTICLVPGLTGWRNPMLARKEMDAIATTFHSYQGILSLSAIVPIA